MSDRTRYADVTIDGVDLDLVIGPGVTGVDVELGIDGAPLFTVTTRDTKRRLLTSGVLDHDGNGKLDRDVDMIVDGQRYGLAAVRKAGATFTLIGLAHAATVLRRQTGALKPAAGTTHVEFARRLVESVGLQFVAPTGKVAAPPAYKAGSRPAVKAKQVEADTTREKGFADGVRLKGLIDDGGHQTPQLTPAQLRNAAIVLSVAAQEGAGAKATLALVEACLVEAPNFDNPAGGDSSSVGVLQLLDIHFGGSVEARRDIPRVVRAFLRDGFTGKGGAITLAQGDLTAGQVAQAVQGSAYPARYDRQQVPAQAIIAAYNGGSLTAAGAGASTVDGPTQTVQSTIARGPNESSWTCLQRMASENGYSCFIVRDLVYYARQQDLMRSRPLMTISEDSPGVDLIDWEWLPNKRSNSTTVTCRAAVWAAPPGSVVMLEDCGPADGRWLVTRFTRSLYSTGASIELRRGTELLQPPKVVNPVTGTGSTAAGSSTTVIPRPEDGAPVGRLSGTPAHIINAYVLPLARKNGMRTGIDVDAVIAANARHGTTNTGGRSDHQGPPEYAWAADMSNSSGGNYDHNAATRQMDQLARDIATLFGLSWTGSGITERTRDGYRIQMLYRTDAGGGHWNHVHCGIKKVA